MSLEEATKIELDIKEYHIRIKEVQNDIEAKKTHYENEKSKVVELFYRIVDDLNEIKNSMKKYETEMDKKNIDIPFPQSDHVAFT